MQSLITSLYAKPPVETEEPPVDNETLELLEEMAVSDHANGQDLKNWKTILTRRPCDDSISCETRNESRRRKPKRHEW